MRRQSTFSRIAHRTSEWAGRPLTFTIALLIIVVWLASGPIFGFSDTWQLVINTGTTIVTFLMVFLIQHTQNCDTKAVQVKLDELIRSTNGAHNALLDLEEMEEKELDEFRERYERLAQKARQEMKEGLADTNVAQI